MRWAFCLDTQKVGDALSTCSRNIYCRECSEHCSLVRGTHNRKAHFRHQAGTTCNLNEGHESTSVDEQRRTGQTPWHQEWSMSVRRECREVRLHGRPRDAALLTSSCIVEFQHSPMSQKEFCLRCASPISQAIWIFDVTDCPTWRCESSIFIDLPSKFDWAYSAEASITLLFQTENKGLYEAISTPICVYLNSDKHIVRAIRRFDPSGLPDVFETGHLPVPAALEQHQDVELLLRVPVSADARCYLPRQAGLVDQPERDRELQQDCRHQARLAAEEERQHKVRLAAEEQEHKRQAAEGQKRQRLAAEKQERECKRQARLATEEQERGKKRLADLASKERKRKRQTCLDAYAHRVIIERERQAKLIGESQMQGKLPVVVEEYLANEAKLWLRLRCAQHDAEHAGAKYTGIRGVDARWYAPSLSWLWLHWKPDKPFVEPDGPASVMSDVRVAIEAHCELPKDE